MQNFDGERFLRECFPDLSEQALKSLGSTSPSRSCSAARALCCTAQERKSFTIGDLQTAAPTRAFIVIENIDVAWTPALGAAWNIDPCFIKDHVAVDPQSNRIWQEIFGSSLAEQKKPLHHVYPHERFATSSMQWIERWHIDGIVEYGAETRYPESSAKVGHLVSRKREQHPILGCHVSTRISYLSAANGVCQSTIVFVCQYLIELTFGQTYYSLTI